MENCDKITTGYDGRNQLLLHINNPTETSDKEHPPPKKRKKLCEQNMFWIDTAREAPEYLSLESGKNLTTNKRKSCTFSNDTYLCEIKTEYPRPNYIETESTFRNPQGYVGRPKTSSFEKPVLDISKDERYFGGRKHQMGKVQLATGETSKYVNNVVLAPKVYRHFTLYPPQNGIISKVEQVPGCKTVIIAGVPHSLKYDTIRHMFNDCGKTEKIMTIEKGVFQITYACQTSVDNLIRLNGYKVVGAHKNISYTGIIEAELAPIWLQKHGFTCKKISYLKYSRKVVVKLIQDLDQDTMVEQCANVLIFWLEGGKCTKNNYLYFFLALQAMHKVVSRCISDQSKFEELVCQNYCSQILKVFSLACSETVLDNLNQFKNQVVKWKKYIEEINGCKSWDAISAFKKTKKDLENSAQQESIASNSLSKFLCSKYIEKAITRLIEGLEQDYINKTRLNKVVLWMKRGRCTRDTNYKYFFVLKTMYGFISRFISGPTKFEELVRRGYCVWILKAFEVACSGAVIENFKWVSDKIKMWKKYIEEVNKCKSWEAISAFAKREMEQKKAKSKNSPTVKEQPNKELKAAETKNYNQNNETGNHNYESDVQSNGIGNHSNENDIQNINNETINPTNENDLQNNKTASRNNETGKQNQENNIQNNETGNHNIGNGIQNKESITQNNNNEDNQTDIGVKIVGKEARLIAALGAFLHLHSFGASIEGICEYLLQMDPTTTCQRIESLMRKFPTVFKEELTSEDKTKWTILEL